MSTEQFRDKIRAFVALGPSAKAAALNLQVSESFLCDVIHGRREPTARLADAMGYEREIQFKKKK